MNSLDERLLYVFHFSSSVFTYFLLWNRKRLHLIACVHWGNVNHTESEYEWPRRERQQRMENPLGDEIKIKIIQNIRHNHVPWSENRRIDERVLRFASCDRKDEE
jgi:hypothetical protein